MKATDFQWIDPIQNNFPDAWRIQETINYGRSKDKDFYPASKKGHSPHVDAMHAANLIFALSLKATKASIEKVLKTRYLLRSKSGSYFMNDFAFSLASPDKLYLIKEIRISTDRPYVEIISEDDNRTVYSSDKFERHDAENFTILTQNFLIGVEIVLNHRIGIDPTDDSESIRAHVRSFKKIQNI